MGKSLKESMNLQELSVPAFGYELIREELLSDLLGKDGPSLLYWAGKRLARKYVLFSIEEICEFFKSAGWGNLQLVNQTKDKMEFSLSSDLITFRLNSSTNASFQLEAGFLAEQIQQQKKMYTEAYEHPKKKEGHIIFTLKWDPQLLD